MLIISSLFTAIFSLLWLTQFLVPPDRRDFIFFGVNFLFMLGWLLTAFLFVKQQCAARPYKGVPLLTK